jgi:hypothetical protein
MKIPDIIIPYVPIGFMLVTISLALYYHFYLFYHYYIFKYNKDVLLTNILVCLFFTSILYYKLMPEIVTIPTTTHFQMAILQLGKFFIDVVGICGVIYGVRGGYNETITIGRACIIFLLAMDSVYIVNAEPGELG